MFVSLRSHGFVGRRADHLAQLRTVVARDAAAERVVESTLRRLHAGVANSGAAPLAAPAPPVPKLRLDKAAQDLLQHTLVHADTLLERADEYA